MNAHDFLFSRMGAGGLFMFLKCCLSFQSGQDIFFKPRSISKGMDFCIYIATCIFLVLNCIYMHTHLRENMI